MAANLDYKPTLDSFVPDKEGWVPPAILAAAREVEAMKNKFPALSQGMRNSGLAGEMTVSVERRWLVVSVCVREGRGKKRVVGG